MNTEKTVNENSPSMARRKVIQSLPFLAAGGLMALLASCTPNRNVARRTPHESPYFETCFA
ncbi:MAG: hypothetical protein L3J39_16290 [Verrucomicrobiales bacterium]|nr:hypothetical protein [Verrucomicrobiales bacterium]